MARFQIREIENRDNEQVATLVCQVLKEHGCVGDGFASSDEELSDMHAAYAAERSVFFVIDDAAGKVHGCGGIAPLNGAEAETCEMRKLYFYAELRGQGWGRKLIELCLNRARDFGFSRCYLETAAPMVRAMAVYEKMGFTKSCHAEGDTGHGGCDIFYVKTL